MTDGERMTFASGRPGYTIGAGNVAVIGETVSHYYVREKIGQGGMGAVYRAEDLALQRSVALKFLSHFESDDSLKERFLREARAVARLQHPNICPIYEIAEDRGYTFLVMAYLDGETLRTRLERGPLEIEEAVRIARQVAAGLAEAHEQGVQHRDIKPENIMITAKGRVQILDFGLALVQGENRLTRTGVIVGTPLYMSPEQATNSSVDERSDIWATGVLLYEMLAGIHPFDGRHELATLYSILNDQPSPLSTLRPDCPPAVAGVVDRALRKEPGERFQTAAEMEAALRSRLERFESASDAAEATAKTTAQSPAAPAGRTRVAETLRPGAERFGGLRRRRWKPAAAALGVGLVVWVSVEWTPHAAFWRGGGEVDLPAEVRLAVLPFEVLGGDENLKALAEGLRTALNDHLADAAGSDRNLSVVSAENLRSETVQAAAAARDLFGANVALDGRLRRQGRSIEVAAELRGIDENRRLGSAAVTADESELGPLSAELAEKLLAVLRVETSLVRPVTSGAAVPSRAVELYLRGRGFMHSTDEAGNLGKAIDVLEEAVRYAPAYAEARAALAQAYWFRGQRTKDKRWADLAVREAERAVEDVPRSAAAHLALGEMYSRSGRPEEGAAELRKAIELGSSSGEAQLGLARVWQSLGRADEAEQALLQAIETNPADAERRSLLGVFYYRNGRYLEAEAAFRAAMSLVPGNHIHPRNLGGVLYAMGRNEEAKAVLQRSVALRPTDRAYSNLGTIYFYEGRYAEAASLYELAIESGANESLTWGNLGDAYKWQGETERARAAYGKAVELAEKEVEISPDDHRARSLLAVLYAKAGRTAEALAAVQGIPETARRTAHLQYRLALVYELSGRRSEALAALRRALEDGYSLTDATQEPELADLRESEEFQRIAEAASAPPSDAPAPP